LLGKGLIMDKPGERLNMLQRNNQQLSAELARVREENQRLEENLSELRTKQVEYTDTVAAVDRVWTQLTEDMAFLVQRSK
jgi:predicted nuclease with TOPRIM domain